MGGRDDAARWLMRGGIVLGVLLVGIAVFRVWQGRADDAITPAVFAAAFFAMASVQAWRLRQSRNQAGDDSPST